MALRSRNEKATRWDGTPKKIRGILDDIGVGENDKGTFRIYRYHDRETGEPGVFFGAAQLDGRRKDGQWLNDGMIRLEDVGHYFEIEYVGKVATKRGTQSHRFNVAVDDTPPGQEPEQARLFDGSPEDASTAEPDPFEVMVPAEDPAKTERRSR